MKQINRLAIVLGLLPAVLSAQYTQSFDGASMPSDWTVSNGGDPENTWDRWTYYDATYEVFPYSGSAFLGIEFSTTAHDDYAISPAITVTPGVSDKLSFWAINAASFYTEKFSVKISTTTPAVSAFTTTLAADITPPGGTWTQYTYDLSAYAGQTIYIAFYSSTTDQWFVGIDDFKVTSSGALATTEISKKEAKIYPNPVADVLNIESKNKISDIKVYDLSGRLQLQVPGNSENVKINVQQLTKGSYIVKFKEGNEERTHKIIKR